MREYVTGLLLDGERKSIEPMAGRLVGDDSEVQAMRQRLQQCVTVSPWSDEELMKRLALKVNGEMPGVEAWVVDDTGFPKKGPARPKGQYGRTPTRWKTGEDKPVTLMGLAMSRGRKATRTVHWREGSRGRQGSRFGAVRVRTAHLHDRGEPPGSEQWFLYEWPSDEKEPTKFWLSALAADTSLKQLVRMAKLRWRVERDYQEMKQEAGLDHFEGRGWRGFHHHGTLCAVAHGFLALRRALFPPEQNALDVA
jgi:SRSO17 transposase